MTIHDDDWDWEYSEPVHVTEWAVIVKVTGELASLGTNEDLARQAAKDRPDLLLVSREVTREPWRVQT